MSLEPELKNRIDGIILSGPVVLFMKGNRQMPQCGFSAQVVQILDRVVDHYETFDVLGDPEVREGIKVYSDWPTIPQLYIGGEFQGGCDIVREMYETGELHQALGVESKEPPAVIDITISEAAADILREAQAQQPGELHLGIDAQFRHSLGFGPASGHERVLEVQGLRVHLDRDSAQRANGLRIDISDEPGGPPLRIDNPNAPQRPTVRPMTTEELQQLLASEEPHRLYDVRPADEREMAAIDGGVAFEESEAVALQALPKDTVLVFYCQHGQRSMHVAQQVAALGFTRVFNLAGGVGAWSLEIDPDVPRY